MADMAIMLALTGWFAAPTPKKSTAPFLATENTAGFEEKRYVEGRRARYEAILEEIRATEEAAARQWCAGQDHV